MAVRLEVSEVRQIAEYGGRASPERAPRSAGGGCGPAAPGGGGRRGRAPPAFAGTQHPPAGVQDRGEPGAPAVGEVDAGLEALHRGDELPQVLVGARGVQVSVAHRVTPERSRGVATEV